MKKKFVATFLVLACIAMAGCDKDVAIQSSTDSGDQGSVVEESANIQEGEADGQTWTENEQDAGETDTSNNQGAEAGSSAKGDLKAGQVSLEVAFGTTAKQDLNGDGSLDTIESSLKIVDYMPVITMSINGTDVSGVVANDDSYWTDAIQEAYYLVDLDTSDRYVEIAIGDHGFSDDPITCFYRYDGTTLKYMGEVYDLIGSYGTVKLGGDGIVEANYRQGLIETLNVRMEYQVTADGKLALVEKDWYEPDYSYVEEDWRYHDILQDVTVYTDNDVNSDKVVLKAGSGKVSFPANDNESWVQVETAEGKLYYLHMVDYLVCESNGQELYVYDIFANLILVG